MEYRSLFQEKTKNKKQKTQHLCLDRRLNTGRWECTQCVEHEVSAIQTGLESEM